MNQADLDRAVAHATGETVSTIKRLGFLLADPIDVGLPDSEDPGPYVIDWDELEARRDGDSERRVEYEPALA